MVRMKSEPVRPCSRCRRPTRPARSYLAEYPGTTIRYGEHCKTCHMGGAAMINPEPRLSDEENRAGLAAYLRRRRDREETMMRREYLDAYPHLARKVTA